VTELAAGARGLNAPVSYALAGICLTAFVAGLWFACGTKTYGPQGQAGAEGGGTRRRLWYMVLGADDRVSTSKVQFALWTGALTWALLTVAMHDAVYPAGTLDSRYLLLLGLPAAAAVGAKAITVGQMTSGTISKASPPYQKKTLRMAVGEIVSNDQGDLDLGDMQYFIFTLVGLAAFFIAFFHDATKLPVLPDTLVGLTSASAGVYVAKKAVSPAPLKITAVSPQKGPPGATIKIFGSGFGNAISGSVSPLYVTVGGLAAGVPGTWTDTLVSVTLPPGLPQGTADVQVTTSDGQTASLPNAFELTP
jgi:hypothetical protein